MINSVSGERSGNNKNIVISPNKVPFQQTPLDPTNINEPNYQETKIIKIPFIKIDHRNKFSNIDEESLINLKISLYTTLASIEEEIIGREIINYLTGLFQMTQIPLK
jgi:hypothetical protein